MCENCKKVYIRETGRKFKTCMKEASIRSQTDLCKTFYKSSKESIWIHYQQVSNNISHWNYQSYHILSKKFCPKSLPGHADGSKKPFTSWRKRTAPWTMIWGISSCPKYTIPWYCHPLPREATTKLNNIAAVESVWIPSTFGSLVWERPQTLMVEINNCKWTSIVCLKKNFKDYQFGSTVVLYKVIMMALISSKNWRALVVTSCIICSYGLFPLRFRGGTDPPHFLCGGYKICGGYEIYPIRISNGIALLNLPCNLWIF